MKEDEDAELGKRMAERGQGDEYPQRRGHLSVYYTKLRELLSDKTCIYFSAQFDSKRVTQSFSAEIYANNAWFLICGESETMIQI